MTTTTPQIPATFRAVIELWPTRAALGRKLASQETGAKVEGSIVRGWYERNSIPEIYWTQVVEAAAAAGFQGVSYALLSSFSRG